MNLDFDEARDDGAEASVGPYPNHLNLIPDRYPCRHLITQFFPGWMLFLTPNQQCQTTVGSCRFRQKIKFNVRDTSLLEPSVDSDAAAETVHQ